MIERILLSRPKIRSTRKARMSLREQPGITRDCVHTAEQTTRTIVCAKSNACENGPQTRQQAALDEYARKSSLCLKNDARKPFRQSVHAFVCLKIDTPLREEENADTRLIVTMKKSNKLQPSVRNSQSRCAYMLMMSSTVKMAWATSDVSLRASLTVTRQWAQAEG